MGGRAVGGNDRLFGGDGDDALTGESDLLMAGSARGGNDWLDGGSGNDTLTGDAATMQDSTSGGNDVLVGGTGNDNLYGDAQTILGTGVTRGTDRFVFANGSGIDTIFDFVFPERAFADNDFVEKLEAEGIVDEDFIRDVLAVDFTRPIFSDDRCGLLEFAPDLDPADRTAEKIRQGFIDELSGQSGDSPAGQLLANLEAAGDSGAHKTAVEAWLTACKGREPADMMADVLKIASLWRNKARGLALFEFPATMPVDDLSVADDARFDPATCVVQ